MHFLPPGVAYTTGLSHNPFTPHPRFERESNDYAKKVVISIHNYVNLLGHPSVKRTGNSHSSVFICERSMWAQ